MYWDVRVKAWKSAQKCTIVFVSMLFVLPLSICYSDSKPSSGSENENGFYVWSNNLNGFLPLSLLFSAPLGEPVAIYLPVSNYSLVNTEKEARKHSCAFSAADRRCSRAPASSFLFSSHTPQPDFHTFGATEVKHPTSVITQYVVHVVHRDVQLVSPSTKA